MGSDQDPLVVLRSAWCRVLDVDDASDDDNFFDLGGNSLAAVELVEEVQSRLAVDFPLETLFLDGRFGAVLAETQSLVSGIDVPE